ncbi:restriction endonuclease subunit S [Shewanella sp. N2AIL]|uniref:restriction endonuclease subunit S n=1 Tax=Shewanella sp. N2AIL TaxID=2926851 RepID=UPI001F56A8F6|nr:restriction endonuclease subunit S [Shewanella sp. N2AIL]MCI2962543.1 restriction endonuclease subunit S [Shewanella sp. N2AIL]
MADLSTPTNDAQSEQTAESLITMTAKDGGNVDHAGAIIDHIDIWTTAIEQKSSAGRGSSNKFSLYGIKKLRELILELAVRGKLVPQDANDEPASVLLERIAAEKAQLVKEGKLKKQKPLPEISEDEKSFELPNGWEWTCLAEIAEIAPRNTGIDDNTETSFIPMPLISTSYKGIHGSEIRLWKEIKKGYTHFADGDIALAKITPCFENSKAAVFSSLVNGVGSGTTELHVARPLDGTLDPLFILLYLKAPMFLLVGETKMTGSAGQKRVPSNFFANHPLPFAPLEEQHRIVAKVDELMSLCDALEAQTEASIAAHQTLVETLLNALLLPQTAANTASQSDVSLEPQLESRSQHFESSLELPFTNSFDKDWQRVAEHFDTLFTTAASIDTLKQTILQLAVMGKLVKQDPNDEPAAKLLERIAKEKAQQIKEGKIKKQKPLPAITDEEKPFELPQGWEWVRFGTLFKSFSNGLYKPAKFYTDDGVISLRMYNIQSGMIDFRGAKRVEVEPNELAQFLLEPNDLLINRVNSKELVGKTAIIPITEEPLVYESMNMRAKPFSEYLSAKYLNLFMMTGIVQESISTFAKEAIGQASINQGQVSSIKTPLPPLEEQNRIVAKVDELMTLCDQLKARLSDAQTTQLHLTDAIVEQVV